MWSLQLYNWSCNRRNGICSGFCLLLLQCLHKLSFMPLNNSWSESEMYLLEVATVYGTLVWHCFTLAMENWSTLCWWVLLQIFEWENENCLGFMCNGWVKAHISEGLERFEPLWMRAGAWVNKGENLCGSKLENRKGVNPICYYTLCQPGECITLSIAHWHAESSSHVQSE
jgi:hypothetical protein